MANVNTVTQDPDDHLFYDIEWATWLASRGLDVGDIIDFTWEATLEAEITQTVVNGTVSRVYIRAIPVKKTVSVTCMISCTNPNGGDPVLMTEAFDIKGVQTT